MPPNNNTANNNGLRGSIHAALQSFESNPLPEAASTLLNTLGYSSDKTIEIPGSDPQAFLELLAEHNQDIEINREKALCDDWLKADILFQLTGEELSHEASLFKDNAVNTGLLQSYLFFAIELNQRDYARGKLTAIARQLNRVFPMPVMVFIKHRDLLSIAVINRRLNKRDAEKDVLGKVTIIRDISLANPHRGHLDILQSFALPSLLAKTAIHSFDSLHTAWEEIFNVELLNERFYKELFKWYFWALPEVSFPDDMKPARLSKEQETDYYEKLRATGLIRLLTRLIFCWFLKEKGLIPETLFDEQALAGILKNLDDDKPTYHQAILQNLFFATLNQRMNARGEQYRVFAKDEGFLKNRNTYGVDNLYRYESLFKDPDAALKEFEDIPFLNGGLFECLDRTDDNGKKIYVDGFSRNGKKRPIIPNRFFFGEGEVNIGAVTGERRRGTEKARGLIQILSNYKFTIVENTPIDQDIALDPELLGKVFENLLASYNEETKTTARKQTGSFYTPRPVVDYMVDESLKAHLATVLGREHDMAEEDARTGLDVLFAYTEKNHPFKDDEVDTLIKAIDSCKILDPACGSGAFPMGALHKLVYILTKLDPDNDRWKQTQLDKLDSISMREELERTFENNNDDYGRKLYLIENCLYGVDIQPIAIQLSKLRFFISLICDQKTSKNKAKNHGVRPLPNLETRFVAADTLIRLGEDAQMELFKSPKVVKIEEELQKVRHDYFAVQRRQQKLALQRKDKELRGKLADELVQTSFADQETSLKLAQWDPYDSHVSAKFFEPLWMFDRSLLSGFDIVIGNPPYQSAIEHKKTVGEDYRELIKKTYSFARGTWDLYVPFFEVAIKLAKTGGVVSFITPNKFLSSSYAKALRQEMPKICRIDRLTDVSHLPVFESASVYPVITKLSKVESSEAYPIHLFLPSTKSSLFNVDEYFELIQDSGNLSALPENLWGFLLSPNLPVLHEMVSGCDILDAVSTVRATTTAAEADLYGGGLEEYPTNGWRVLNTGTIDPFLNLWGEKPLRHQGATYDMPVLPVDFPGVSGGRRQLYSMPKILVAKMALQFEGFVDKEGRYAALNCNCVSAPRGGWSLYALALMLHSSSVAFVYKQYFDGLRMSGGYLPFQAPQLKTIPIPAAQSVNNLVLDCLGRLRAFLAECASSEISAIEKFVAELGDACVMEGYFHDHMHERDLLFQSDIAMLLDKYDPDACETEQLEFIKHFYQTANAPDHPIRNRLLRLTADSPDLLAVIKEHGAV